MPRGKRAGVLTVKKKTKIRIRILKTFSALMFFALFLTGAIFNIAIRLRIAGMDGDYNLLVGRHTYGDAVEITNRAGLILIVLTVVIFIMTLIVTYFLANSITRPIEKLSRFSLRIGGGDFTPNTFEFDEEELEDLNTALNKSVRQLGVYDSEQRTFFQNVSHELRTPLMSIKCYAEGISFGIMEPRKASETILEEVDRLSDLVTDLLYYSKIDNITTVYKTAEENLTKLLRDCALRQQVMADKKQIKFSFDFGGNDIYCNCVEELLSRAVDNLISNAVRYAGSEIILSCAKRESCIEISVSDDGCGIAEDAIPYLFERFYKGPDGNHGIGLPIVKSIAEQHKGHVTAKNTSSGGAMFTITLPVSL